MAQKLLENGDTDSIDLDAVDNHAILFGFNLRIEQMPDASQERLYTLTHPDLPGLAYSDSDEWDCLLAGMAAAIRILRARKESGEAIPLAKDRRH